jgi:hypothetical protein
MASSQIAGATILNIMEVEAATKAARVTIRPEDYGSNGIYSIGNSNGATAMSAGLAAGSPIFSLRWTHATKLALIKRFTLSMGAGATAFAAGAAQFHLFVARSFTGSDTGGTSILPSGNQNKLRTATMAATQIGDARISATVTLTAGTRTLDANPIASVVAGVPATAGTPILAPFAMFDQRPGEHPLVLAQNEGIVLQATVPVTGVWFFAAKADLTEIDSY